ncbi:MAG TPA: class I SAM-dependent methyltransferase [Stellaceae bacterium]|nr:class I SAM-dependent methyltransferase [Stellaceae bacterium]
MNDLAQRQLTDLEAKSLPAGSAHYTTYVGPPAQYDLMGATQFRLLVTLGLREFHTVLDFGCGSLRAGRLLIPYLAHGHYHGIEPNVWLVEDAIERQLGADLIALKRPQFHAFGDFRAERCGVDFDFILAQSIFSHCGADLIATTLRGFRLSLATHGLALVTMLHPGQDGADEFHGSGWIYPDSIAHAAPTFARLVAEAELVCRRLPWFHPRQTWYAVAHDPCALPPRSFDRHLCGAVLNVPDWEASLNDRRRSVLGGGSLRRWWSQ